MLAFSCFPSTGFVGSLGALPGFPSFSFTTGFDIGTPGGPWGRGSTAGADLPFDFGSLGVCPEVYAISSPSFFAPVFPEALRLNGNLPFLNLILS